MLRRGVSILAVGAVFAWVLSASGGLGSCGPRPGMLPILIGFMLALPLGALLTVIGLGQLVFQRLRNRDRQGESLRITSR